MIVLGLDPGYAIVGYGAIETQRGKHRLLCYGAITTPAGMEMSRRLLEISRDMHTLLDQVRPDAVAVEELFFNNNITTGIQVAQARGVLLAACAERGLTPVAYTPSQVKQSVVGYGKAGKAGHGDDPHDAGAEGRPPAGRRGGRAGHRPVSRPHGGQYPAGKIKKGLETSPFVITFYIPANCMGPRS